MDWEGGRRSDNVEDRRGIGIPGGVAGGGIGVVVLALVAMFFGVDPRVVLQEVGQDQATSGQQQAVPVDPAQDKLKDFVSVVLADTEDTWGEIFQRGGAQYERPKLVLFTGAVRSACGLARSAVGPFYCPGDHKVYIDLDFYRMLEKRFGAPGEFAKAYVVAHEVGHHVQNLLGISGKVQAAMQRSSQERANQLSVRQELQADCYAGIWANHANRSRHIIQSGDIESALNAAAAIGDDKLQMQAQGYVAPESFTHGSSAQRVQWFKRGWESGELSACDTFRSSHN
ncbi:MAG TPA: neutral zinc metallopeptidase [Burkholderiales bacterium]|nr:neutral zinc metallopeptidase [Burkholderiales bacterium]